MPILDADKAHTVIVLKRRLNPGFAGEDNELFYEQKTMMVFGDAKATLMTLVQLIKQTGQPAAKTSPSGSSETGGSQKTGPAPVAAQ